MRWRRLEFTVAGADLAHCEPALAELGALSTTFRDAADQPLLEPAPGETPLWDEVRVEALFDAGDDLAAVVDTLQRALPLRDGTVDIHDVREQAWERAWMERFAPMRFGRRLWIYPSHITPPDDGRVAVILDPGLAFGTGTHPTTALCLRWLDAHPPAGKTVLDYGCGSGVLAIAAARLGAPRVYATDIDPQALTATQNNATANAAAGQLETGDPGQAPPADLVLANILSGVLIELAGIVSERLRAGGRLVLSGILHDQADAVRAAYAPYVEFTGVEREEDWVLLEGLRRP